MGLETRGNKRYYYKKRRDGDRVRSVYVGKESEVQERVGDDNRRRQLAKERNEARVLGRELLEFERKVTAIRDAYLIANGYHNHKGQWRKKQ